MIYLDRFQVEEGDWEHGRVYCVRDMELDLIVAYGDYVEMRGYKELREYGVQQVPRKELPEG